MKLIKIRNVLTTSVLASAFIMGMGTTVSADSQENNVSAGTTPDSFLYAFDKGFENVQLFLTNDSAKESKLLLKFAQERLSESDVLIEEGKKTYLKQLIDDYIQTVVKAEEKVSEVATDGKVDQQVKEQLSQSLEGVANVNEKIKNQLDTSTKKQLEEKQLETRIVASVIKDMDAATVKHFREQGLGFRKIVRVQAIAEISGKTSEEIASMFKQGKDFGEIARELELNSEEVLKKVSEKKRNGLNKALANAEKTGNEKKIQLMKNKIQEIDLREKEILAKKEVKLIKKQRQEDKNKAHENYDQQIKVEKSIPKEKKIHKQRTEDENKDENENKNEQETTKENEKQQEDKLIRKQQESATMKANEIREKKIKREKEVREKKEKKQMKIEKRKIDENKDGNEEEKIEDENKDGNEEEKIEDGNKDGNEEELNEEELNEEELNEEELNEEELNEEENKE